MRDEAGAPTTPPRHPRDVWVCIVGHTLNPARHAKRSFPVLLALAARMVGSLCIWASLEMCGTK